MLDDLFGMPDDSILTPAEDEYHTKMVGTNSTRTNEDSEHFILDIMESLISARKEDKIITAFHLEFTFIDDPNVIKVSYEPGGRPDSPNNEE